jgi:hypothetical protein
MTLVFTPHDRDRVHETLVEWGASDPRVVSGAVVGSMAHQPGDRFSDLDLAFGVREGVAIAAVLEDWSARLKTEFDAFPLLDLPSHGAIYRVFLLPGCLQVDLSFAPAQEFGAIGPNFRLLFGTSVVKPVPPLPAAGHLFGYGVHHAIRARVCIERGRYWQAEYWISGVRDHALTMACLRLGLPAHYGRGFDDLPETLRAAAAAGLVDTPERKALLRALRRSVELLLAEGAAASASSSRLYDRVLDFVSLTEL